MGAEPSIPDIRKGRRLDNYQEVRAGETFHLLIVLTKLCNVPVLMQYFAILCRKTFVFCSGFVSYGGE